MKPRITICMGSSCFLRGNRRNLELIESYLAARGIAARVDLVGSRCEGACGSGPNIRINGRIFPAVKPETLQELLDRHVGNGDRGEA